MIGRARSRHLVLLLCITIPCWVGAFAASASAGPLDGVTGPVSEAVGEPVREVVETVTPPLQETTEAKSGPVQEVTETPPPVREVAEAATPPVEKIAKEVTPSVKAAAETVAHPPASPSPGSPRSPAGQVAGTVRGAVSAAGATTTPKAEAVNRATSGAAEDLTETVRPAPKYARPSGSGSTVPAPDEVTNRGPASPPSSEPTARPRGATFVPSPSKTGATAAPLPKWVSYIWPAVALLGPDLVNLLDRSEPVLRQMFGTSDGSGGDGAVAGVHASGGRFGPSGSSSTASPSSPSSPFSRITSAVGQFPYNVSGAVLAYILIVAIMLIGLFVAIRWEIANGRREGRG